MRVSKPRLAIIGTGISAMGCVHYLQDHFAISLFDKNDYAGGHTHTHTIHEGDATYTLDTGFIVFNNETYPHLLKLFSELGVEKQESDMSFSVWNKDLNLQYCSSGISHLFAQKRNIFSLQYRRFLYDIIKFFRIARKEYTSMLTSSISIKEYCVSRGLSMYFVDNFIVPMSAAVWSTPHETVYDFPISLLLPFFHNHGLLGVDKQFQWYTVAGGSNTYTHKILEKGLCDLKLSEPVEHIEQKQEGVIVVTPKKAYTFDKVIVATHADQALKLVSGLSDEKKRVLSAFTYNKNTAVLHTDESIMPPLRSVRSSWNQVQCTNSSGSMQASTIYRLNKLQNPPTKKNYFVSINPHQDINPNKIIKTLAYDHPLFTTKNIGLQQDLSQLNEDTNIYFTGSYFRYGFHEDGLMSALHVVDRLL